MNIIARAFVRTLFFAAACTGIASAQPCSLIGDFQPFSPGYHTAAGQPGLLIQSNTLYVDTDRDGIVGPGDTGDSSFPLPSELRSPNAAPLNPRLSPTQDFFFTAGGQQGSCSSAGTHVRIYKLPPISGQPMELIFDDCLACQGNDGAVPLWYDYGITQGGFVGQPPMPNATALSQRRLAYIRTNVSPASCGSGQPQLRLYDLVAREMVSYDLGLLPGTGVSLVSPGGDYMVFQHDLTIGPDDSDVVVFNLCDITPLTPIVGNPPTFNNVSIVGIRARVEASGSGTATINILNGASQVMWTANPPCCSGPLAPLGSCCVNNNCSVGYQADCAGVWVENGSCVNTACVPSAPDPIGNITAPTPITVGQSITAPVSITNNGQSTAVGVVATLSWSTAQAFSLVSASNGGAPLPNNPRTVRWNIASIAPGATVNLSANLLTACFTGPQTFQLDITATGVSLRSATQMVQVNSRPATPITVAISSVPSSVPPLLPGALVTHTITLANSGASATPSFRLVSQFGVFAGLSAEFVGINDCAGGTTCELINGNFQLSWAGVLAAGQTRNIVFTTRVTDCYDSANPFTSLAWGRPIYAQDSCDSVLGVSGQTPGFALAPPLSAALQAVNTQSGVIGAPSAPSPAGVVIQVVDATPPPPLTLRATFTNRLATTLGLGTITLPLPPEWTVTSAPTNGAVYDSNTNQVTFTGSLAPSASISFEVGVQTGTITSSNNTFTLRRQTAACLRSVAGLSLIAAPTLPAGPFVLGINRFFGVPVTIIERGVDTSPRDFIGGGVWNGITASSQDDLWFIGAPLTVFNPSTLRYDQFTEANTFASALSPPCELIDGAVQESTGDVILFAYPANFQTGDSYLLRFDPITRQASVIAPVPGPIPSSSLAEVFIDAAGDILYCNHDQILRYIGARGPQLPPNSGVPIAVPHPVYTDPNYGTIAAQRVWTFAPLCDGTFAILHASEFDNVTGLNFYTKARVFALSVFDPGAGTIRVIDALFAGEAGSGGSWSYSASLAPTFQISHPYPFEAGTISMVQSEPGEVITGNNSYPAFHTAAIDLATGALTYLQNPAQFGFKSALDIVYRQPASTTCSPGTVCIGDFNQDGGIDGADIGAFILTWEAGDFAADVNQDGGVDGADLDTFILHWEAGC